jgi:hypothetical protein
MDLFDNVKWDEEGNSKEDSSKASTAIPPSMKIESLKLDSSGREDRAWGNNIRPFGPKIDDASAASTGEKDTNKPHVVYATTSFDHGDVSADDSDAELRRMPDPLRPLNSEAVRKAREFPHSIPGMPGIHYPTLRRIPKTNFSCGDQQWPGYYADVAADCQVSCDK